MKPQINVDGILRDMTDVEIAQYEIDQLQSAKLKAADEQKAAARVALLDRLGISAEEAALLLK
jgi:hypothetical protein